jgi:hypothetical protein
MQVWTPKKRRLLIVLLVFFNYNTTIVKAQQPRNIPIHIQAGMGAYSSQQIGALSTATNFARAANETNLSAGIMVERRFNLQELSNMYAAFTTPVHKQGNIVSTLQYVGNTILNETNLSVGYSRFLNNKFALGVGFNYYNVKVSGYGNDGVVNATISGYLQMNPQLAIGVQAENIMPNKFGATKAEKLAQIITLGIGYQPSKTVYLSAEAVKEESYPLYTVVKLRYMPVDKLALQAGVSTQNNNINFAASFITKHIEVLVGIGYQNRLGASPVFAANYY